MILSYWHLLGMGLVLLAFEMLIPGTFYFLWLGVSTLAVGGVMFLFPQLTLLPLISLWAAFCFVGLYVTKKYPPYSLKADQEVGERLNQYIGKTYVLEEPIQNGEGRLRLSGSYWRIKGPDLPKKTKIVIVKLESTVFIVEKTK